MAIRNSGLLMKNFYRIAELSFSLEGPPAVESLLPSYAPFRVHDCDDVIFEAHIEFGAAEVQASSLVGVFDSGGATYRVSFDVNENYIFEILTPRESVRAATLFVDRTFSEAKIFVEPTSSSLGLNNSLMVVYAFSSVRFNALLMHSSVVSNEGYAFLFLGTSGTGKSTHSSMWLKNIPGTELMNDDNPVLRVQGAKVFVYGSPWSGKTPCYKNVMAPVGAIVKIAQHPLNEISLLDSLNSFAVMTSSCSRLKWDKVISNQIFDTITKVVYLTNIFQLNCRPDAEAAQVCHQSVFKNIHAKAE